MNIEQFLENEKRTFEYNFLDGDTMEDCGKCMLTIDEDYIQHYKDHDTSLINFVLDKVKEEMKNKTFMCDQLMGDLVVDMEDISTIIDNLKIK